MLISFSSGKLEKILSDEKALTRRYGPEQAKKIQQRLFELQAAENLDTLKTLPQVRAHELTGNRAGQISLDMKHPYRLLITPDYESPPLKEDGGFDWKQIKKVKVLKVEDTHG
jgi:plasmid maintenance system killer protein